MNVVITVIFCAVLAWAFWTMFRSASRAMPPDITRTDHEPPTESQTQIDRNGPR